MRRHKAAVGAADARGAGARGRTGPAQPRGGPREPRGRARQPGGGRRPPGVGLHGEPLQGLDGRPRRRRARSRRSTCSNDGATRIRTELKDQPLVRARLLETIGEVYRSNGLYEQGRPLLVEALDVRRPGAGPRRPGLADPLQSLAMLDRQAGRSADAEAPLREAIRILEQRSADPLARARALMALSSVESDRGNFEEAERLLLEVVAIREQRVRRQLGPGGDAQQPRQPVQRDEALPGRRARARAQPGHEGEGARASATSSSPRASTTWRTRTSRSTSFDKAADTTGARSSSSRRCLEVGHPEIAVSEHNLGDVAYKAGDLKKAEAQYLLAREHWEKRLGPEHVVPRLQRRRARQRLPRPGPAREGRGPLPERRSRLIVKGYGPATPRPRKSRPSTTS